MQGALIGFLAALSGFLSVAPSVSAESGVPAKVVVIPIRAQIAKPELYILRRGLKEAIENKVDTVVLDMEGRRLGWSLPAWGSERRDPPAARRT